MKNILAKGGIEFLAVFLGIVLSLWGDDYRNKLNTKNEIRSLIDALALELKDNKETLGYIIKNIDYNIKFTDKLLETDILLNQSTSSKDSIWNANIIPLGNKLYVNAYDNIISSGLIYEMSDKKLIYEIQNTYEHNVVLFHWWIDYETKFTEHIDKYIFKNLALNKTGTNWELDWENEVTLRGIKTTEFQNIIIGNRANREILKEIAGMLIKSKEKLLKDVISYNSSK